MTSTSACSGFLSCPWAIQASCHPSLCLTSYLFLEHSPLQAPNPAVTVPFPADLSSEVTLRQHAPDPRLAQAPITRSQSACALPSFRFRKCLLELLLNIHCVNLPC